MSHNKTKPNRLQKSDRRLTKIGRQLQEAKGPRKVARLKKAFVKEFYAGMTL